MGETYRIERLGHQGDGIAQGPLYAHGALPGELVSGALSGDRVTDVKIIEPSELRVKAPCRHYRTCGGCALQHARDDFVSDWKAEVVRNALAAQGIKAEIECVLTSPAGSRRRAVLHGQRTKKGSIVGIFARFSDILIDTPECLVLHPALLAVIPALHELTRAGGSRAGRIDFSLLAGEAGVDVSTTGGKPLDRDLLVVLSEIASQQGLARLSWNEEVIVTRETPFVRFGPATIVPPPGAFLQATADGEAALLAEVRSSMDGAKRVVDLFAGCGTFSLPLTKASEVHAVEGLANLVEAAHTGWRKVGGLRTLTTEVRDLFNRPLLAEELNQFDAVILDPPRAGAEAQCREIAGSDVARVALVSCNPVSFARDAKILTDAGFRMAPVTIIDQFRWSNHVELVTHFTR